MVTELYFDQIDEGNNFSSNVWFIQDIVSLFRISFAAEKNLRRDR